MNNLTIIGVLLTWGAIMASGVTLGVMISWRDMRDGKNSREKMFGWVLVWSSILVSGLALGTMAL